MVKPGVVLLLRILVAVCITTYFVPDEFWQHGEVAHDVAFGFGHRTWEWSTEHRIRSIVPLLPTIGAYRVLALSVRPPVTFVLADLSFPGREQGMDSVWAVWLVPRIFAGLVAGIADLAVANIFLRWFPPRLAVASSLTFSLGWFSLYCLSRPLVNSVETAGVAVAIAGWVSAPPGRPVASPVFTGAAVLTALLRPTAALFLGFFVFFETLRAFFKADHRIVPRLLCPSLRSLMGAAAAATFVIGADSAFYGEWPTVTAANFVKFNAAGDGGSALFGEHPTHWYLTAGAPVVLAAMLPFTLDNAIYMLAKRSNTARLQTGTVAAPPDGRRPCDAPRCLADREAVMQQAWGSALGASAVLVYALSLVPHKEFRFLLPVLPWLAPLAGITFERAFPVGGTWRSVFCHSRGRSSLIVIAVNAAIAAYACFVHQRGPVALGHLLRLGAASGRLAGVDVLAPCHSTPAYSEVHAPIHLRFIPCDMSDLAAGTSPSAAFEEDPASFVRAEYKGAGRQRLRAASGLAPPARIPSHVVFFDAHAPALSPVLEDLGFAKATTLFHTHINGDGDANGTSTHVHLWSRVPMP